jgi:hypothetical protein
MPADFSATALAALAPAGLPQLHGIDELPGPTVPLFWHSA